MIGEEGYLFGVREPGHGCGTICMCIDMVVGVKIQFESLVPAAAFLDQALALRPMTCDSSPQETLIIYFLPVPTDVSSLPVYW